LGSLPPRVRELYGLRYTPLQAAACASTLRTLRLVGVFTPRSLKRGSCIADFQVVAETERRRIARGQPTPQLVNFGAGRSAPVEP
jgi:hypothetical protein